ncbi:MAG TPA: hypothetical protein VIF63_00435 [Candidatus Limnocylindrales bacterium]|jgi:hypothetical protein
MTSNQKKGFRLPWGTARPDEGGTNLLDPAVLESRIDVKRDDLGDGPSRPSRGARSKTTDAAPAAADVPVETPEAAMNDADESLTESAAAPPDENGDVNGVWPTFDRRATDRRAADRRGTDRPFMNPQAVAEQRLPRRDNPLVAGLVKAMREAAIASRGETTARLEAEATARVEAIRARATTEVAELRKRSEEDITSIRDWSKIEIARVRQETDDKIDQRKVELAGETERHAATVDQLVEQVQTTVAAFEADMERFFERLLAETDPATLATLAEQAPDPPDLRGEGPAATDFIGDASMDDEAMADASMDAPMDAPVNAPDGLAAGAAAEAEAEATEGLDPLGIEDWPTAVLTAAHRSDAVQTPAEPNGPDSTRLFVSGLTSVAGISAFKGALGQLDGVRSVSVSSGEAGVFVFAVSHDPGVDLDSALSHLTGFAAQVTDATDDGFTVVAAEAA